jgi:hypothetical protein
MTFRETPPGIFADVAQRVDHLQELARIYGCWRGLSGRPQSGIEDREAEV